MARWTNSKPTQEEELKRREGELGLGTVDELEADPGGRTITRTWYGERP